MKSQVLATNPSGQVCHLEKKSLCGFFYEELLESYPKLKEGGGYELMRAKFRSTSKLEILQPKGNGGHNMLDLKEMMSSLKFMSGPLERFKS